MHSPSLISRRDFLKMAAFATSTVILGSCSSIAILPTEIPILPTTSPTFKPIKTIIPTTTPTIKPIKAIVPELVLVETGSFQMGSMDGYPNEQPVHTVIISNSFYIGKYAVTFDEYDLFCEVTGLSKSDDRNWGRGKLPIIHVDFYNATDYCNWLSKKEGLVPCYNGKGRNIQCDFSANGYRLPTEAEWEFAARGGQKSQGFVYAGGNNPEDVAWFDENSNGQMHPVGNKLPNELDLYDMSGNLYEWCWDWYSKDYYDSSPTNDPLGPPTPQVNNPWDLTRVRRSGSWRENRDCVRITFRSFDAVSYPGDNGFRLARTA